MLKHVTLLLSLVVGAALQLAPGAEVSPLTQLVFQPSMQAGSRDVNGKLVAGTEVMHLVPHKGRLYASTSLWMEKDPSVPKACQILVLDSPQGQWRVEHQFTTNNLRWGCLKAVTFSADKVSLLLAAPDVRRGPVRILCRNDDTGEWTASVLGSVTNYTTTRAIGQHRDNVPGMERIFAGTDKLGVISGVYDAAAPGRIRWGNAPEFRVPAGERVMAFCNCGGAFYCATSRHIFRRTDGTTPSWKEIYFCEKETSPSGIRGLSAVPNPSGTGEVLLFAALSKIHRLDPADGFKETIELGMPTFLTRKLGVKVSYALPAYNEFMPYTMPGTGELVWLFGFELGYPRAVMETKPQPNLRMFVNEDKHWYFAAEARYCIRHVKGADIRYDLAEVTDPRQPTLVSVRVIAVSPFAEDQGRAFYFGGFDCNSVPSHNTAWIYRGVLAAN